MRIEDQASDLEILQREAAESAVRRRVPTGPGSPACRHCGEALPALRQAGGYRSCVPCQTRIEQRARLVTLRK